MKKIYVFIIFAVLTINVSAQVQTYTKFSQESVDWDINVFGINKISGNWYYNYFFLVEQYWAEGLVGLEYQLSEEAGISFMAGMEQNPGIWRWGFYVYASRHGLSYFANAEFGDGSDNMWYKTYLIYDLPGALEGFKVGIMSWRYNVTGLYLEAPPIIPGVSPWINIGRDLEFRENRILVGIDIDI
jgi:hypothetical protein